MHAHDQQQSPLFRLPAELRDKIYTLALTSHVAINDPVRHSALWQHYHYLLGTSLIQTCKRIYAELDNHSLYRENTFRFTRPHVATNFLATLGDEQRKLVRHCVFDLHTFVLGEWLHFLQYPVPELCRQRSSHAVCLQCAPHGAGLLADHIQNLDEVTLDLVTLQKQGFTHSQQMDVVKLEMAVQQHFLQGNWAFAVQIRCILTNDQAEQIAEEIDLVPKLKSLFNACQEVAEKHDRVAFDETTQGGKYAPRVITLWRKDHWVLERVSGRSVAVHVSGSRWACTL